MSAKKPLVLDINGELQQIQNGDFLDVTQGGTGAVSAAQALINLGAASAINLTAEVNRATTAEAALAANNTTNATAITTETTRATAAEGTLTTNLASETAARIAADALLVPQTTTVNGHALNANITVTAADVGAINTNQLGIANGVATLDGTGKLTTSQIPAALVGAVVYQGTWNAATNTPALASGTGVKGQYYKVNTPGTTSIDGIASWGLGDTIIFDGVTWDKIDGQATEVVSVVGQIGVVTAAQIAAALSGQTLNIVGTSTGLSGTNLTGDVVNIGNALTVVKINGTSLAGLGTGILKNTTGTGVPSIAVPADFPILNQNTTGKAATAGNSDTVTTNANLSGDVVSIGNVTTLAKVINGISLINNEATVVAAGTPVYTDASGTFKKADGSTAATAEVIGLANANIVNGAAGIIKTGDILTLTTAQWDAITGQVGGLTAGAKYFLNPTTAGLITSTLPTTGFLIAVGQALSTTSMLVRIGYRVQL